VSVGTGQIYNLCIPRRGLTLVEGPSGSGKTTLLKAVLEGESERRSSILSALSLFSEVPTPLKITQPRHSLLHGSILNLPKCRLLNRALTTHDTIDYALKLSENIIPITSGEEDISHDFLKYVIATYPDAKVAITTPTYIFLNTNNLLLYFEKFGISQVIINNKLIPLRDILPSYIDKELSVAFVVDRCTISNRNYDRLIDALKLSAQIMEELEIPANDICKGDLWLRADKTSDVTKISSDNYTQSRLSNLSSTPSSLNDWLLYLQAIRKPTNVKYASLIQTLSWLKNLGLASIPSNTTVNSLPHATRILIEIYSGYLDSFFDDSFLLIDLPNNPLPNSINKAILDLTEHLIKKEVGILLTNPSREIKEITHTLIRLTEPKPIAPPFTDICVVQREHKLTPNLLSPTLQLDQSIYKINLERLQEIPYKLNQQHNFTRPILISDETKDNSSLTLKWSEDFVIPSSSLIKLGNLLKITTHIRDSFVALPLARQRGVSRKDFYSRKQSNNSCVKELYLRGYSYDAIMSATLAEVSELFCNHPKLHHIFPLLASHNLLHLSLKRPFITLSSGEQHRVNLLRIALNLKDNQVWIIENFDWELTEIQKKNLCKIFSTKLPATSAAIIRTSPNNS
jgi:hypothetical protein